MKNKLTLEKLNIGIKFSDSELRQLMGGDDTPINGGQYGPGVTIYPDPTPPSTYVPVYYNPVTGGHDSSAPTTGGGGGTYSPPAPVSTLNPDGSRTLAHLPTLDNTFGQVGANTCTVGAMEFIEKYFKGTKSFDTLLTNEAQVEINQGILPAGTSLAAAKLAVYTNGYQGTIAQFNSMINGEFNASPVTSFKDASAAIDMDHPIMGFLTNSVTNGVTDGHEIVLIGYDSKANTYQYYDPLDNKSYDHHIDAGKVSDLQAIGELE